MGRGGRSKSKKQKQRQQQKRAERSRRKRRAPQASSAPARSFLALDDSVPPWPIPARLRHETNEACQCGEWECASCGSCTDGVESWTACPCGCDDEVVYCSLCACEYAEMDAGRTGEPLASLAPALWEQASARLVARARALEAEAAEERARAAAYVERSLAAGPRDSLSVGGRDENTVVVMVEVDDQQPAGLLGALGQLLSSVLGFPGTPEYVKAPRDELSDADRGEPGR